MKKLIFLILFCLMAAIAFSALTYGPDHYRRRTTYLGSGNTRLDPLYLFMNEIDGYLSGSNALTMIFFDPTTEPTAADKGLVYYDGASNTLKFYNGSAWTALATAAGNSLDLSYDAGAGITVDAGAVTLTTSADSDSAALDIVHGETGAYPALSISNAGTDPAIEITTSGTGADITGTSATWSISKTGAITCVGITNTGTVNFDSADVHFDATDAGKDVYWDDSHETFGFFDNAILGFGNTTTAPDVSIMWDGSNLLIESATEDTGEIQIGSTNAIDVVIYGNTNTKKAMFNANTATLELTDYDVQFTDSGILMFGSDDDFTIAFDGTNGDLDILGSGLEVSFGVSGEGIDVIMHGETAGEYFMWDESADSVIANCGNVSLTTVDAEANQFKIDATGTVAGYAVVIETTDGGVQIKADGADNGDIAIAAGDDMTLTAGGDLTLAVTGSLKMGGALIANNRITTIVDPDDRILTAAESGSTIVFTMTGGAATCTLPEATADNIGMWFILVDGNPTSGRDLSVDPEGTGTINGNGAGEKITCENDRDGEAVYIFSTAADTWYAVFLGSSTVWTEE